MNDDPVQMNDSGQATVSDPASTPVAKPKDEKDPLAVLEKILQDAKNKRASGGAGSDAARQPAADGPALAEDESEVPELTPEEIAEKEAEKEAEAAAQKAADEAEAARLEAERQAQIEEQRHKIETEVKATPQYQAAVQQEEEKHQADVAAEAAGEGFDIKQIDHVKN